MSSSSTFNTDSRHLCIPRVFKNITEERIARCLALALGVSERDPSFIDRIDMVPRTDKNDKEYWRVFIHLNFYPATSEGAEVEQMISAGETVTIVYDEPWYWKVSRSRLSKPGDQSNGGRRRPRPYLATNTTKPAGKHVRKQRVSERDNGAVAAETDNNGAVAATTMSAVVDYCDP